MKRATQFAIALITAVVLLPAADQGLLSLAMPDAKVLVGADVERMRVTPFGRFLLDQFQKEEKNFQEFIAVTGFDPRRDVREVLVASSEAPEKGPGKGVVLVRGSFDTTRIQTFLKSMGEGSVVNYQGVDIIAGKETKSPAPGSFAVLNSTLAAMGDLDNLKAVIDRQKGGQSLDSRTISRVQQLSAANHLWLLTTLPLADVAGKVGNSQASGVMKGDAFKSIEQITCALNFGEAKVQLTGEAVAGSEKDASALADVVKFVVGIVQLNRDNKETADMAAVLDTLEVKASGSSVKLTLAVPEEQVENLIRGKSDKNVIRNISAEK